MRMEEPNVLPVYFLKWRDVGQCVVDGYVWATCKRLRPSVIFSARIRLRWYRGGGEREEVWLSLFLSERFYRVFRRFTMKTTNTPLNVFDVCYKWPMERWGKWLLLTDSLTYSPEISFSIKIRNIGQINTLVPVFPRRLNVWWVENRRAYDVPYGRTTSPRGSRLSQ